MRAWMRAAARRSRSRLNQESKTGVVKIAGTV
jgi:hypothetical protein